MAKPKFPKKSNGAKPYPSSMITPPATPESSVTAKPSSFIVRARRRSPLDHDWGFLTCGIFLGAHWAYSVLGWGGYWGWDPVENASLMPWLAGTAFLHSVMMQEKRGMLKVWNMSLVFRHLLAGHSRHIPDSQWNHRLGPRLRPVFDRRVVRLVSAITWPLYVFFFVKNKSILSTQTQTRVDDLARVQFPV